MKIVKYLLILIGFFIITSFSDTKDKNQLLQVWVFERYDDGILTYLHKHNFSKNKSGIEFKANGILRVKQNSSWCGTDPIKYEIVTGKWNQVNDSIIDIEYKSWAGNNSERRQIMEIKKNELRLKDIERN